MKKRLFSLGLAVAMAASLTACGGSKTAETTTAAPAAESSAAGETTAAGEAAETTEAAGGVIKIGGIGPTTGGAAVYGLAVQRGAQLAVDEINAAGGINGAQVEFKFEDDEHDAEKSVNAYNTLKTGVCRLLWEPLPLLPVLRLLIRRPLTTCSRSHHPVLL